MNADKADGMGSKGLSFGLGGLLKGVGDFLELIQNMADEGKETYTQKGDFSGNHNGRGILGRYGITVRLGADGDKKLDKFGDIDSREDGPQWESCLEPVVDVYDEGEILAVIAEVPGVSEEGIVAVVEGKKLKLEARGSLRHYRRVINLPAEVEAYPTATAYNNGILELKFRKQTA